MKILWRYDVISIFGEFPKFRKIPRGVNGEPLTGNIGDRNDFIFGDIMKIGWAGVIAGARTPIFCLNFFWRIFKMTEIFRDFSVFLFYDFPT